MTFNYAKLRDNTAEPLLARFGKSGTLKQAGATTGDDWDPTPGTATSYTVTLVEVAFTKEDRADGLVQQNDVMYLVSTDGTHSDIKQDDTLTVGGTTYQVVRSRPLQPGSVLMLWRVHCRR